MKRERNKTKKNENFPIELVRPQNMNIHADMYEIIEICLNKIYVYGINLDTVLALSLFFLFFILIQPSHHLVILALYVCVQFGALGARM